MSDLLTHWAVFDDLRRIAAHDALVAPTLRTLLDDEREAARLGAITRGGNRFMEGVLRRARDAWADLEGDARALAGRKVAFCLGCLTHQACDRAMKPLLSASAGADWGQGHRLMQRGGGDAGILREVSAYYDVHVFREVYENGAAEPFSHFLLRDNATAPGAALEAFARSLFQRALLSSHTLKPDQGDIEGWLERLFDTVQALYLDIELYTRVYERPDPAKVARYGVKTTFYREDDPGVRLARLLRGGASASSEEVGGALRPEVNKGSYALALALGITYLRRASDFWQGEADALVTPNVTP